MNCAGLARFLLLLVMAAAAVCVSAGAAGDSSGTKPGWNEISISRIAIKDATGSIDFFFCSDLHIPFDNKGIVRKIVREANEKKPDFVLLGGDLVQMGLPSYFTTLNKVLRKFRTPVISAIGNHDTSYTDYSDQEEWKDFFGKTYFSFDAGPARFIFLNCANHNLPDAQLDFLRDELKTDLQKFIVMHRPVGYLNELYDTPLKGGSERFRELIEDAGVTAVMTGHEHHHGYYEVNGIKFIVSGGAGGRLNKNTTGTFHHYIFGHVTDKSFNFDVINL